jgi:phosphate transport system permease protein
VNSKSSIYNRPSRPIEAAGETLIRIVAFISLAAILLIFVFTFREALSLFRPPTVAATDSISYESSESYGDDPGDTARTFEILHTAISEDQHLEGEKFSFRDLFTLDWQPVSDFPKYGLLPIIIGSFKVTIIALLIAGPFGILSALYATSFAPRWTRGWLKPAIELLAGFPSVVVGFFALTVLATLLQSTFGWQFRLNSLTGGIALALAVVPIIFTVTEDALNTVPRALSEASLALGASKWQTTLFIILPAATPGVLASLILGFGRAFGETMIVLMATGNAALTTINPAEPIRTMSATIGAEMAEVVFGDIHYGVLFFIGVLLFVVTFALNAVAEFYVRQRLRKRFGGR